MGRAERCKRRADVPLRPRCVVVPGAWDPSGPSEVDHFAMDRARGPFV